MKHYYRSLLFAGLIACSGEGAVLDFSGLGIPSGGALPQTHGDTAQISVQYLTRLGLGNTFVVDLNLYYGASGRVGTTDVAHVNPACGASACTAEIFLIPASGLQVTLNSFQLTTPGFQLITQFGIFDASFASLASSGGTFPISSLQTFGPGVTSSSGIRLQWGPDASGVAIDNIDFTVSLVPVPEPSTLIFMATAIAMIARRARKRVVVGWVLLLATSSFRSEAAPVTAIQFVEKSSIQPNYPDPAKIIDEVTNSCGPICGTFPTSVNLVESRTVASAFTDGLGGSGLSVASIESNRTTTARTEETGHFHATSDVEVRVQAYFPGITLTGVFADPGSRVAYGIDIRLSTPLLFASFNTQGFLRSTGFTITGEDIGAVYDAAHHTVTVHAFLFDRVLGTVSAGSDFTVAVLKGVDYVGTDFVEMGRASIVDPFGVSAPGIVRNGLIFTETGSVPEPGTWLLTGAGLSLAIMRCRRRLR